MRKIIEIRQENKIECDNCTFVIENENPSQLANIEEYVNMPCPKYKSNLCTPKDYLDYVSFVKLVYRANKWLGWLSIFFGSQTVTTQSNKVKIHNGIQLNNPTE